MSNETRFVMGLVLCMACTLSPAVMLPRFSRLTGSNGSIELAKAGLGTEFQVCTFHSRSVNVTLFEKCLQPA